MDQTLVHSLDEVYRRYGFEAAKVYESEQVLVYTLKTGYFDNADIVQVSEGANPEKAFSEFSKAGFACTVRPFQSAQQAENQLFKGFFSVDSIVGRLESEYQKFTKGIVEPFSPIAVYEYINAPYQINGRKGELSPAEEVTTRLSSTKPTLFLIEAAAGFGKTCTAYELVNRIVKRGDYLPLFSELARNRQAVIFRYILLDEIDRTFPVLSSKLVQAEMKNGRVITILDGFDELLRKTEQGIDFENSEPMLETIGEFLTGNAKIVLTTRRTVLFEGDAFHNWADKHSEMFDLVRIKISEPHVNDWLEAPRYEAIKKHGFDVDNIANPVLLSYLRCIPEQEFEKAVSMPSLLVDKYFDFMLERERVRQDLRMDAATQKKVLRSIAEDMIAYSYTSEQRDYIVDHILKVNGKLLDEAVQAYSASERPTRESISHKLASHALLDRSVREPNKIGFVNEFVFGNFIGETVLNTQDWLNDDLRFIEPAVVAFQPRAQEAKDALWEKLRNSVEFLPISDRIDITVRMRNAIDFPLSSDEANGLELTGIGIGTNSISDFQFNECIFRNCEFHTTNLNNVTFLNCKYYGNQIVGVISSQSIHVLGGIGDADFIEKLVAVAKYVSGEIEPDRRQLLERFILEKFWPVGRANIAFKLRPIKVVCAHAKEFLTHELYNTINLLKKDGILKVPLQSGWIEINHDRLHDICEILGRQTPNG